MIPYIVLNDDVLRQRILPDSRLLAQFPMVVNFRQELTKLDKECLSCSGKETARKNLRDFMQRVRIWVAGLSENDKALIREVLAVPAGREAMVSFFEGTGANQKLKRVHF